MVAVVICPKVELARDVGIVVVRSRAAEHVAAGIAARVADHVGVGCQCPRRALTGTVMLNW